LSVTLISIHLFLGSFLHFGYSIRLQPTFVRKLIKLVAIHEKVRSFDICEVNPSLDIDNRTAKLATYYVNEVVQAFSKNS
ncbi:arginase family protein, partial [Lysinibacillus sp. NPDC097231]|uniref:arginase family protein n=1 Tax=Lysinibacillus sp. NPDC097231 TaxID=3364142 RepID=UPI0037F191F7